MPIAPWVSWVASVVVITVVSMAIFIGGVIAVVRLAGTS
jgi:hypothetical protein